MSEPHDGEGRNVLMGEHSSQNTFKDPELVKHFKSEKDKYMLGVNPFEQNLLDKGLDRANDMDSAEAKAVLKAWTRKPRVLMEDMNISPLLDYSFQDLKIITELGTRDPSAGVRKERVVVEEEPVVKKDEDGESKVVSTRKKVDEETKRRPTITNAIKLSYNELTDMKGLTVALEEVMEDPQNNLNMLDLSHNQLTTIEPEICNFKNLSILYLHGNQITNIAEVKKLGKLTNLKILTMHGNALIIERPGQGKKVKRLEEVPYYRLNVIYRLRATALKTLDQVPITPKDKQNALIWDKNHRAKPKPS